MPMLTANVVTPFNDAPLDTTNKEESLCALILVECLVTEDAPNGLICMG